MTDDFRVTGRRGVAAARAALEVAEPITWDRDAKCYRACGLTFESWAKAIEHVLALPEEPS